MLKNSDIPQETDLNHVSVGRVGSVKEDLPKGILNLSKPTLLEILFFISIIIIYLSLTLHIFYCPQYDSLVASCNLWGYP